MFLASNFARLASTLGLFAASASFFGCVLLADIDETQIADGSGGAASSPSSSSSSSSTGAGGAGGTGAECQTDADCPGIIGDCGRPRCFSDGRCGFDNEPIGAPCAEDGGAACNGKGQCIECVLDVHCASGKCGPDRTCLPPTCNDLLKNGDETDLDCGGSCVARCGPAAGCAADADCLGGSCIGGTCAPTCTDQFINGQETAPDCGGPDCPKCSLEKTCKMAADCLSGYCFLGQCTPAPTCTDSLKNGTETDVDCGGPVCSPCGDDRPCLVGSDCESFSCVNFLCAAATCTDGIKNGAEPATDCGATCPTGCPPGTSCTANEDCASKKCEGPPGSTVCGEPSCFDGIWNGDETSYDCGGSCAVKCPPLYPCLIDGDCRGGLCDPMTLTCAPTCTDQAQNQGETDPDCGGPCPTKCPLGWHCFIDDDCASGLYCTQGHCLP